MLGFVACSSKSSEKNSPGSGTEDSATSASLAKAPARISFRLDDSKGEMYVARPATDDGLELTSFVAAKAKSIESWQSIELGLVNGSTRKLSEFAPASKFYLTQHQPKGIDLIELDGKGNRALVVGPLVSMHLRTNVDLRKAPMADGKAILVVELPRKSVQILPAELTTLTSIKMEGPESRSGWSLVDAISAHFPIAKIASIEAHAAGQVERFSSEALQDKSLHLLLRHNKRGELRLKVYRDGTETQGGLRALQRIVVVEF